MGCQARDDTLDAMSLVEFKSIVGTTSPIVAELGKECRIGCLEHIADVIKEDDLAESCDRSSFAKFKSDFSQVSKGRCVKRTEDQAQVDTVVTALRASQHNRIRLAKRFPQNTMVQGLLDFSLYLRDATFLTDTDFTDLKYSGQGQEDVNTLRGKWV